MEYWLWILVAVVVVLGFGAYAARRVMALRRNRVRDPRGAADALVGGPLAFSVTSIDGRTGSLEQYRGSVVLMVNVASQCGLTPQYAGLESLYAKYKDRGLVVIGFPANNFGRQEPGTETQIKTFCETRYGVTFPMMAKISVKGPDKHSLFKYLTEPPTARPFAGEIGWNFAKFLIDRSGRVMARFGPFTPPGHRAVVAAIEKALDAR